jgi:IrrE N-terminal-like domain
MDILRRAKFIEAQADAAIEKTGQRMPPIDLDAIARYYGIPVRQGERDEGVGAHFDPARNAIVLGEFVRWPFAHELGHALLKHGSWICDLGVTSVVDDEDDQAPLGTPFEAEANRFARHLLVPRTMVESLMARGAKIKDIARRCEVTELVAWNALSFYRLV